MKFKKSWIFWISYYATTIIGTGLAVYFFNDRLNVSFFSIFPIFCILSYIICAWLSPSRYHTLWYLFPYSHHTDSSKKLDNSDNTDVLSCISKFKFTLSDGFFIEDTFTYKHTYPKDKFASRAFLLTLPIFIPFVFFFSNIAKLLIMFCFFAPFIVLRIAILLIEKKESDLHVAKTKQQLKEQQEKEELGKWK